MKLRIKWSSLNEDQRKSVKSFYTEEVKRHELVLNQRSYPIDTNTGKFVPFKDF
jgi:hypothetical protein